MKHTNIRKQSRLLVEHILNNDPLSANDIFRSLINEAQLIREAEAAEEAGVAEEPVEDAEPAEPVETEEPVETIEPVETEEETEEEIETEPISDEANSDEIDSMVDDVVEIVGTQFGKAGEPQPQRLDGYHLARTCQFVEVVAKLNGIAHRDKQVVVLGVHGQLPAVVFLVNARDISL